MNIKQWFLNWLGDLGQFLKVLFKDALQAELKAVMPIALKVVKQVAADPTLLNGGAKRDAAIEQIQNELVKSQIQVGLSVVSLAVELAVQNIKNPDVK